MKISAIVKGGICLLGLVGVGNILAAPASAGQGQASARGAVTVVRSSGSSISVSAELTAPSGTYFAGPTLTVTPTTSDPGLNIETVSVLVIDPGAVTVIPSAPSATIQAAIASKIDAATVTDVQDISSLVRAAASGNGGLE